MRILLAQNSLYYPAHGGGDKSNRLLVENLAHRGHACRVVARIAKFGEREHAAYVAELAARSVNVRCPEPGVVAFEHGGVDVRVVTNRPNLRAYFASEAMEFHPDAILTSTDDPAQILLEAALGIEGAAVVHLARATLALPFGPDSAFPSEAKTETLRRAAAIVGVSEYVAGYIRRWGGIDAVHVPISLMDPGPYPELGRFDNEYVTLVNPCAVKGISIFLSLADRMPDARFGAVPTWGTNAQDRAALAARPNVRVLDPVDDIGDLLARTRVLLVPSLWAEARSRIIVEAMLRGVPVIASDVGGIPEAKMGVPYVLPVRPIAKYRPALDEQMVPVAEVPGQDIEPWDAALRRLTSDRHLYAEISRRSREAALEYVSGLSVEPFERVVEQAIAKPRRSAPAHVPHGRAFDRLTPEKRQLAALLLKRAQRAKAGASLWFPGIDPESKASVRLFCFPHAGGGAAAFHGWLDALPKEVAVCPVRLPGRETRIRERPFTSMTELVAAVAAAVKPYAAGRFALYGHSMGAAVAFELARALRASGSPQPAALFVAAARAPQFRAGWVPPPEPSEQEFAAELRRLEGVRPEVLNNPELLQLVLPSLRADTMLYRQYIYAAGPPLECPIFAYGGLEDPNVSPEHVRAWSAQTTSCFNARLLPGGHFFAQARRTEFLAALAADLRGVL